MSTFWIIFALSYMALGILMMEWAWKRTVRIREVNEERDSLFPAFRRTDAHKWNKLMFYPFAMTMVPFRFVFGLIPLASIGVWSWFVRIGHDESKPITGCRKKLIVYYYYYVVSYIILMLNTWVTFSDLDDFDYSYWLGPDYKTKQKLPKNVSTIVAAPH